MKRDRLPEDDDGRTVADMSGVASQPLLIPGRPVGPKKQEHVPEEPERDERPWEKNQDLMSKEDRRLYILGALKAALLIALAFIVGLGAFIAGPKQRAQRCDVLAGFADLAVVLRKESLQNRRVFTAVFSFLMGKLMI